MLLVYETSLNERIEDVKSRAGIPISMSSTSTIAALYKLNPDADLTAISRIFDGVVEQIEDDR